MSKTAELLRVTYGPNGLNVLVEKPCKSPQVTRDGMMAARATLHVNQVEELGNSLLKLAGTILNNKVGDGTTTVMLLTEELYRQGHKLVMAGADPIALKRGLDRAMSVALETLKGLKLGGSVDGNLLRRFISRVAHDEGIAKVIAEAIELAGKDGTVLVEESKGTETKLTQVDGLWFDQGLVDSRFERNDRGEVELARPLIFVSDVYFTKTEEIVPLLEIAHKYKQPILIIAHDIVGDARKTLLTNIHRKTVQAAAVRAPDFGDRRMDMLQDIAVFTKAKPFYMAAGQKLDNIHTNDLGEAATVRCSDRKTIIMDGIGEQKEILARVRAIKEKIQNTESGHDRDQMRKRLSQILGGVSTIKVGGNTESEVKEKKGRIEDALSASRSLLKHGPVLAGGQTLLKISQRLKEDQDLASQLLASVLETPFNLLCEKSGLPKSIAERLTEIWPSHPTYGACFEKKVLVDFWEEGLVESIDEVKTAILLAVSAAGTLLTAECAIVEVR